MLPYQQRSPLLQTPAGRHHTASTLTGARHCRQPAPWTRAGAADAPATSAPEQLPGNPPDYHQQLTVPHEIPPASAHVQAQGGAPPQDPVEALIARRRRVREAHNAAAAAAAAARAGAVPAPPQPSQTAQAEPPPAPPLPPPPPPPPPPANSPGGTPWVPQYGAHAEAAARSAAAESAPPRAPPKVMPSVRLGSGPFAPSPDLVPDLPPGLSGPARVPVQSALQAQAHDQGAPGHRVPLQPHRLPPTASQGVAAAAQGTPQPAQAPSEHHTSSAGYASAGWAHQAQPPSQPPAQALPDSPHPQPAARTAAQPQPHLPAQPPPAGMPLDPGTGRQQGPGAGQPAPGRRARAAKPAAMALPSLLNLPKAPKGQRKGAAGKGLGIDILAGSGLGGGSGSGGVVGSGRRAKAELLEDVQSLGLPGRSRLSGGSDPWDGGRQQWQQQDAYRSSDWDDDEPYESGGKGSGGLGSARLSAASSAPTSGAQSPGEKGAAASTPAAPAPSAGAAAAALAAAAEAAARKGSKKGGGVSWLSAFKHAEKTGGTRGVADAGGAAGKEAAPVKDMAEQAAAMVAAAARRPAAELDKSIKDLAFPLAELQSRLEAAVRAEQDSERRALAALYGSGSLRRLQREGVVLAGLDAAQHGTLYRSTLWRFAVRPSSGTGTGTAQLPYHKFRPGTSVIITRFKREEEDAKGRGEKGKGRGRGAGALATFGDEEEDEEEANQDGPAVGVDEETGLPTDGVDGVVVEAAKDQLVVALEGRSHEAFRALVAEADARAGPGGTAPRRGGGAGGGGPFHGWRLDQSVRDTTSRRHLEAIRRLGRWAEAEESGRLGEARVRSVLAGSRSASVIAAEAPEWVKEDAWRRDARAALEAQPGLNASQRRAVSAALSSTVSLWQGPPGTGKTRTLLALIEVLVRVRLSGDPSRAAAMGPVLAVADTNAAVDNLVEGLAGRLGTGKGKGGPLVVRLGPAAKARESLRHFSLEALAEATPLGRKAAGMRAAALRRQEAWGGDAEVRADLDKAEALLREAAAGVAAGAAVVCCTCTTSGDGILDGRPWRCVVVDEASQATAPAALVALTRGSAFVVLAGDPRQLPPTVTSAEAVQAGLGVTLFERIAERGVTPLLLDTQYRMHPAISAFPSAFFYGGRLRDGVEAADKPVPRGFPWPDPAQPLAVVAVAGGAEESSGGPAEPPAAAAAVTLQPGGRGAGKTGAAAGAAAGGGGDRSSYRNPREALLALAAAEQLLAAGDISSAAILTPYRGQVRLIEALSRQRGCEARWAARGLEVAVSTVDGYQGREADVVIFSAVRANARGAVGFLSDSRRMNVALTRPRRGLVLLADPATLGAGSRDWGTYLKWARQQRIVCDDDVIDVPAWIAGAGPAPAAGGVDARGDAGRAVPSPSPSPAPPPSSGSRRRRLSAGEVAAAAADALDSSELEEEEQGEGGGGEGAGGPAGGRGGREAAAAGPPRARVRQRRAAVKAGAYGGGRGEPRL